HRLTILRHLNYKGVRWADCVVQDSLKHALRVGLAIVAFFCLSFSLYAQTVGSLATISGTVFDPDKNVVPNAGVSVKNDLTAAVRTTVTGPDGQFSVTQVPVGTYTIEVSSPGFTTARSSGLELSANGLENIRIALSLASVSQEVIVSEFLPLAAT